MEGNEAKESESSTRNTGDDKVDHIAVKVLKVVSTVHE